MENIEATSIASLSNKERQNPKRKGEGTSRQKQIVQVQTHHENMEQRDLSPTL